MANSAFPETFSNKEVQLRPQSSFVFHQDPPSFYRGAHGRLCNFSCTNATIKKFKDALAKHSTAGCSLGPAKGLEESELLALAANKDLSFSYTKKPALVPTPDDVAEKAPLIPEPFVPVNTRATQDSEEKTLLAAGRR